MPHSLQENAISGRNWSWRNWYFSTATTIVALFIAQGLFFIFTNSQTYDEAVHLGAGYSYLATGDYRLNQEHPPLIKIFCALPVYLWYQLPFEPVPEDWQNADQRNISLDFLYNSSISADTILSLARFSNLLLGAVLVCTIGLWSNQLWGKPASLLSMSLAAFDPNLIAHSSLVTTDIGVATFSCLTLYCFWRYTHRQSWGRVIAVSIFLGCALATKFSAVSLIILITGAAIILLLAGDGLRLPSQTKSEDASKVYQAIHRLWHTILLGGIAAVGSALVVWASYEFGDATVWWHGLQDVLNHQNDGHATYLMGEYSQTGWPHYFIIAFLIKTPVASLSAMALSIGVFWKGKAWSTGAFVTILLPVYLIFTVTTQAQINIGLRHILLVFPLLFVAAGRMATFQAKTARTVQAACFVIVLGTFTSALFTAPHYLAYFNEIVGGPSKGGYYLSDSNIDWGQDLKQLANYIERENASTIYLSYFGPTPHEYPGIDCQYLSAPTPPDTASFDIVPTEAKPQLLAISLVNLQGVYLEEPDIYDWLSKRQPITQIGYSIFVFDISDDADAHVQLAYMYRKSGRKEYVAPEMKKALAIDPTNQDANDYLTDISE